MGQLRPPQLILSVSPPPAARAGLCKFGSACKFAHGEQQPPHAPNNTQVPQPTLASADHCRAQQRRSRAFRCRSTPARLATATSEVCTCHRPCQSKLPTAVPPPFPSLQAVLPSVVLAIAVVSCAQFECIVCLVDNTAAEHTLNKGSSKNPAFCGLTG